MKLLGVKILNVALTSCLLAVLLPKEARGMFKCACDAPPPFEESVDSSDTVLRVRIKKIQDKTDETKTVSARVKTVFKGSITKKRIKIVVDSDRKSCGYFRFKKNTDYLIFPSPTSRNKYTVGQCFWDAKWKDVVAARKKFLNSLTTGQDEGLSFVRTSVGDPLPATIRLADETVTEGYSDCEELITDLEQVLRFYASNIILDNGDRNKRGGADLAFDEQAEAADDTSKESDAGEEEITEDSFGTNNQIEGVDEADIVKSDGTYVYLAYGDTLVVWNATSGAEVARTVMPRPPEVVNDDCENAKRRGSIFPFEEDCYGRGQSYASIDGILLEGNRLTLIVSGYTYFYYPYLLARGGERVASVLSDYGSSSIRIYDTSALGEGGTLELLATKDLKGVYNEGRSIGTKAHIATSTTVNTWAHIDSFLYRWNDRYDGLNDTAYVAAATMVAEEIVPLLALRIATELDDDGECQGIARLAAYVTADFGKDLDGDGEITNDESRRILDDALSFRSIVIVTSFDTDEDFDALPVGENSTVAEIPTQSAAAFFGQYGPSIITASENRMIFTADGYHWDDETWSSSTCTYILVFTLPSDEEDGAAEPSAFGLVEGYPINKFAIDEHEGNLRIGTTEWARWACERFRTDNRYGYRFCARWKQVSEIENQVIILEYPTEEENKVMKEIGRVDDLGKPGESLFALRFQGDKAFAVTFERIDPFYTLNLADPTAPFAEGELEITGFSTYLHLIEDDQFVLAVGQEANDRGRILGVAVSLFNVTDFKEPSLAARYVVEEDENLWSFSSASFDSKAFRYLPQSGVLILPLTTYGARRDDFTDGFLVIKVDVEKPEISFKFFIDHAEVQRRNRCYSHAYLPSRSLVFKGKATTMKGHVVMSTDLNTEELRWVFDIDKNRKEEEEDCFGWFG